MPNDFVPIEGIHFNKPFSPPANRPSPAPPPPTQTPSQPFYQPPTITADTPGVDTAMLAMEEAMRAEGKLFINGKWTTPTAAGQQPDFEAAAVLPTPITQPKQFYRIGEDIFNASTNQKIGATDWQQNWATDANSTEVQAATLTSPTGKKETVGVGSSYAGNLLDTNWTVGDKLGGGTAIDGDTLAPVEPIVMDDPTIPTDTSGSTIKSAEETIKSIDDYMADVTPPETDTSKEKDEITTEMSNILTQMEGQETMRQEEEEKRGVDTILESLKTINNQLKIKLASYRQLQADIQGKPITMASIIGSQRQIDAVAQADIGFLQAQSSALQNDLTFAQEQAQKAVNNKFAPLTEKYNLLIKQLELLKPQLDKEGKIWANALTRQYNDQQTAIAEQKATEADIQNIALTALQNSGGDMAIYNQIVNSGSVAGAVSSAGELYNTSGWTYVGTPAERDALIAQGYELQQIGGRTYARPTEEMGEILSLSEAKTLGVPYGTTRQQAINMGITLSSGDGSGGRLTVSNLKTAKGNYLLANPKATSANFDALSDDDKLRWYKGGVTPVVSPYDADFEGAARVVMSLEDENVSSNEAYWGVVGGLSEDLGLPEETANTMLINKINELKGVQPQTPPPVIEENIGSDFKVDEFKEEGKGYFDEQGNFIPFEKKISDEDILKVIK